MSNVAILQHDRNGMARAAAAGADFLGPVEVTAVRAQEVDVRLPSGADVAVALRALVDRFPTIEGRIFGSLGEVAMSRIVTDPYPERAKARTAASRMSSRACSMARFRRLPVCGIIMHVPSE